MGNGFPAGLLRQTGLLIGASEYAFEYSSAEMALTWARACEAALQESPWRGGEHHGDCTREPYSCAVCLIEEWERKAELMLLAEGFMPGDFPNWEEMKR